MTLGGQKWRRGRENCPGRSGAKCREDTEEGRRDKQWWQTHHCQQGRDGNCPNPETPWAKHGDKGSKREQKFWKLQKTFNGQKKQGRKWSTAVTGEESLHQSAPGSFAFSWLGRECQNAECRSSAAVGMRKGRDTDSAAVLPCPGEIWSTSLAWS